MVSEVFSFVYYALLYDNIRVQLEFILELFRLAILFVMGNFYIKKASNLLAKKKMARRLIMIVYLIITLIFVILGAFQIADTWKME